MSDPALTATRRRSNAAPASGPRLVVAEAPASTCEAKPDLLDLARQYAAVRLEADAVKERETRLKEALVAAFTEEKQKAVATEYGLVSYKAGTSDKEEIDEKAIAALLKARGLPQVPTAEEWVAQYKDEHGAPLKAPTKTKKGNAATVEFRAAK